MSQQTSDLLTERFKGKTVTGIDVETNIIYIHFTDGSQIRAQASGYEGTRLDLFIEYMKTGNFNLLKE